jgi:transposase InsO family protein
MDFKLKNGKIYHKSGLEVVPKQNVLETLQTMYEKNKDILLGQSVVSLYKFVSNHYINITRKEVGEFLTSLPSKQLTNDIHKVVNKPIVERYPNARHQADLIDMSNYVKSNYGHNYIYVQVDVFSRKCWLRPLKQKTAEETSIALLSVLNEMDTTPVLLQTDNGGEFKEKYDDICEQVGIKHLFTESHSPNQTAIVERTNLRVRKILRQYFLSNNTFKWYNILDKVQDNLNNTYLQVIKSAPNEIWRPDNNPLTNRDFPATLIKGHKRLEAQKRQLDNARKKIEKYKEIDNYEEGDIVRVKMSSIFSNVRRIIKQGNSKQIVVTWTPYTFEVTKVIRRRNGTLERNRYELSDANGVPIRNHKGKVKYFYASELYQILSQEENIAPISMEDALKLNQVETSQTDALYE